ncbi:MAG TPA: hypothetical protein DCW34_03645 [Erysipelotrichaceae bacterium]|nr:hypothetical protein [Erysipelotrichaceae bacterium]
MILFASDFDSTLRFTDEKGNGYFKNEDVKAIDAFRQEGNVFGICTGRPLHGMDEDLKGAPEVDYVIASSGGLITSLEDHDYRILWEKTIPLQRVIEIYERSEALGYQIYVHGDGYVYTVDHRRPHYDNQIVLKTLAELNHSHISGISIWTPMDETAAAFTAQLDQEIDDIAAYQNRNWMDIVPEGVSKGTGVIKAMELFHCDHTVCIGDSYNDIPMLIDGELSFTFHSSPQEVKDAADFVVENIAEAIAVAKEKLK